MRRYRKKAAAVFTAFSSAAAGTLLILLPISGAAASAEAAAFLAAKTSAVFFAAAEPLPETAAAENTETVCALADEKDRADKPEPVVAALCFSVDDSEMLSRGELLMPDSSDEERSVPSLPSENGGAVPYPESLENRDGAIKAMFYGHMDGDNYVSLDTAGQVRNLTDLPNERVLEESRLPPDFEIELNSGTDRPQVLIMHTHATESYEPYERDFYDKSFTSRTTDKNMNMAAVGDEIAAELEAAGISVIHDTTLHDYPSYNGSYDLSRKTVRDYLEEYPSIKAVLDIHRDAIERSGGERIAPTAEIDGRNAAQVMIISGCDDGTMDMPNCMKNLRFACALEQQLESDWAGLTRPVLFDYRKYNQDLTTGSLLIEVGSHANSIDQARYSGKLIGKSLAKCLINGT